MRALERKLFRDLSRTKAQAIAIAAVVASGMALFVATAATTRALTLSEQRYYTDQRFAHIWSSLTRAPARVLDRLATIPGVAAVDGRLVAQGVLNVPNVDEPANGLFISISSRPGHALNDVYIRRGRHVEANGANDALVGEAFAKRNGLSVGDDVYAVIAGQPVALHLVGIALSPEYLMQIPPGGRIPDDRRFGVFWLARDRLEGILDARRSFNDVAIRLSNLAAEPRVIAAIDHVLEPYGGRGAFGRTSQPSHVMLEDHIAPLSAMSTVIPGVFFVVTMFLVNVVLSRLVSTERTQIGMMKAFGYSNRRLAAHYLLFVCVIVGGGIVVAVPIGVWLGHMMSVWFATFFLFPELVFRVEPRIVLIGAVAMLGTSAIGALATLRVVVSLPPSVAMTPPAPTYRPKLFDRLATVTRICGPAGRMIVRSVSRRPVRAVISTIGMSAAVGIVVLGEFMPASMSRLLDAQYQRAEREDLSVVLTQKQSLERWSDFQGLPGVRIAEPFRAVPARLLTARGTHDVTLLGLESANRLRHIVGSNLQEVPVPPDGAVISAWLAGHFGIGRGESIAIEVRDGRHRVITTRVVALVDEPIGTSVYMDLRSLGRRLEEPNTFGQVNILVDPAHLSGLYAALKRSPHVLGVDFRQVSIANVRAMSDQSVTFLRLIELIFAVIIACGVVYNTARIAIAERAYELATLRVLGFSRRGISAILLGEIAALALPAIPLGCVLGYGLSRWLAHTVSTDLFRFPFVMAPSSYALALGVFASAVATSAFLVRRRLDRLDLVEVLKARE